MYDNRKDLNMGEVPVFENVKNDDKLNDSVLDYQNGAVHSRTYSYDYSIPIPLDQVPYRPHNE